MLKRVLGILLILASFMSVSTKSLLVTAANAQEADGSGHEGSEKGATCG